MSADDVNREVEEVLSRPEFDYGPSWWEQAVEWLAERLEDLLGPLLPEAGTFGGGASSLVAWLVIVAAAALVVFAVVRAVRNRRAGRGSDDATPFEVDVDHQQPASHWRDEAGRLEAAGEWREALRARVRQLVRTLTDEGLVTDSAGRTTGELRTELGGSAPGAVPDVDVVFGRFESVWYGGAGHDGDDHAAVVAHVEAALRATSSHVATSSAPSGPAS